MCLSERSLRNKFSEAVIGIQWGRGVLIGFLLKKGLRALIGDGVLIGYRALSQNFMVYENEQRNKAASSAG